MFLRDDACHGFSEWRILHFFYKKGGFMKWPHTKVTAMYDNGLGHSMPACRNAIKACRHVALNK